MVDINLIKTQVKDIIEYSQNIKDAKVDYLIDTWYEAKKDFIKMFNNQLIYSTSDKITIDLNEEQKISKIEDFCFQILDSFPQYADLVNFIQKNRNDFFKNILSNTYAEDNYYIPSGIKLSKAFKKFVSDETDLYYIQTLASRVIQESKITGYLCLSVHPLDYLSSSETTYNWRSCHSLDGEYRAGNLSYMLDKSTIVCYLCGDKQEVLPRFPQSVPWNSKKWRMLLFVSDNKNALFAGRHYPFFSKTIMEEIRCRWKTAYKNFYKLNEYFTFSDSWSNWHDDYYKKIHYKEWEISDNFILNDRYIPMRDSIYSMKNLIHNSTSNLHYNDLLNSSCYIPYYCWFKWSGEPINFTIGHSVKCLKCEDNYLWDHESMLCSECLENNGFIHCGDCGEIISIDNAIYVDSEDRYICTSCFEEYYFQCPYCGDIVHQDYGYYDENRDNVYCIDCYKEINS